MKVYLIVVYSVGLRSLEDRSLFLAMGLMSRYGGQRPEAEVIINPIRGGLFLGKVLMQCIT